MKLTELKPVFLSTGGPGITRSDTGEPVPKTEGVGVAFDCPCGNNDEQHRCYVPFANPIGPGPHTPSAAERGWQRTGETFETLTLTPSIQRIGDCRWHGFITNGEVRTV
jgi:hypothetical protein